MEQKLKIPEMNSLNIRQSCMPKSMSTDDRSADHHHRHCWAVPFDVEVIEREAQW